MITLETLGTAVGTTVGTTVGTAVGVGIDVGVAIGMVPAIAVGTVPFGNFRRLRALPIASELE
jgi:hypothetical protein